MFKIEIKNRDTNIKKEYNLPSSFEIIFSNNTFVHSENKVCGRITNINEINNTLFQISEDFSNQIHLEISLYQNNILIFRGYANYLAYLFQKNKEDEVFNEFLKFYV